MSLLIDLFGYLTILLHGCAIVAQSMALGGMLFLLLLARPLADTLIPGRQIVAGTTRIAAIAAFALIAVEALFLALQVAVLRGTVGIGVFDVLGADFAVASEVKIGAALVLGIGLLTRAPAALLLAAGLIELIAATFTTHAAARLEGSDLLLVMEALHQLGAAIWIGGIPCFVLALAHLGRARAPDWSTARGLGRVGSRFSRLSMTGVACIIVSGAVMAIYYVGSWAAFYGTAYGVMVGAKVAMFGMLLLLGLGNLLVTERLRQGGNAPVLRLRRFAEVEIGIGFTLFFAAASLTSSPPAIDVTQDRVTWHEIVERFEPVWPRFVSPDHDQLALIRLQDRLDQDARAMHARAVPQAFVPGSGELPPRNAADIAWSEYNHHWAGLFVVAIALLALLNQAGQRWARHWPLVFLGLAAFLFLRSDPEVWPLGQEGIFASLRDIEVLQHRVFVLLIVVFGLFEWRVRAGRLGHTRAALVFPIMTALGGALLLTHSHAISNVKDALLIELSHTPLALIAIVAAWARWLELRLDGRIARVAGWVWPVCFLLCGLILLDYREA